MKRDGEVASKRQRFRESSVVWHRFLGFELGLDETGIHDRNRERKRAPFEEEYEEARKHFRVLEVVAWLVLSFIECSEPS
jgi:hypothetical protein